MYIFRKKGFFLSLLLDALEAVSEQFSGRLRIFPVKFLKWGNFWQRLFLNRIQHSWVSEIYGTLKHALNTIRWLWTFWIWQISFWSISSNLWLNLMNCCARGFRHVVGVILVLFLCDSTGVVVILVLFVCDSTGLVVILVLFVYDSTGSEWHWQQNEGECFFEKKKKKKKYSRVIWFTLIVQERLSHLIPVLWLAVATPWDLHYTFRHQVNHKTMYLCLKDTQTGNKL